MSTREEIESLLELNEYIDLIIPRGSNELVSMIQKQSQGIPVLGHSEGVCHVYIDQSVDEDMALKIGNYRGRKEGGGHMYIVQTERRRHGPQYR